MLGVKLSAEVADECTISLIFTSSYIGCKMEGNPAFNVANNILQQGNDIAFICFNVFHALLVVQYVHLFYLEYFSRKNFL